MSLILGLRVMTILTKRVLVYIEIVEISCPCPECVQCTTCSSMEGTSVVGYLSLSLIVVGKLKCREGI
jgi:hypothetical protein